MASAAPSTASTAGDTSTTVGDVTVTGARSYEKSKVSATDRKLKVSTTSASSCGFTPGADDYIEDYIAAATGSRTRSSASLSAPDLLGGGVSTEAYFSENSPSGFDASTENMPALPAGCHPQDMAVVAGRATIARHDKTLPEGYRLYDEKKYPEALASFTRAYKKLPDRDGGNEAALMIGKINLVGAQGQPDMKEAVLWLTRAATSRFDHSLSSTDTPPFDPAYPQGSLTTISDAALTLGRLYLTGEGVAKDPKAARKWFERANYVGYVPAGKTLGDIHYYGFDTPKDLNQAVSYYTEAATLGYGPAAYSLGEIYQSGEAGVAANPQKALGFYLVAARVKHPGALEALAVAYDTGQGVAADPQKALAFYREAAIAGNADAQAAMGSYFYEGSSGLAKDDVAARRWFETAASHGQGDAMFNLAVMQMKGEGGPKDLVRSSVWFRLARTMGHPNAEAALAAVEKQMSPAEKQAANAIVKPEEAR